MKSQRLVDSEAPRSAGNRLLARYWEEKRADRAYPAWRDVHLMDLWRIADRLTVKDVLADGDDFRNRYWGSRLAEAFAIDGTGKTPSQVVGGDDRLETALVNFRRVVETGEPVLSRRRLTFMDDRDHIVFEAVHLPLGPDPRTVSHIISAYDFDVDRTDVLDD